jgi:putative ABC transport system permease protein
MISELREEFSEVIDSISLNVSLGNGRTSQGRIYANLSLIGVNEDYSKANNVNLQSGRFLNSRDMDASKKVAVISDKMASKMFENADAIGKQITVQTQTHTGVYTIVGIYAYEQNIMDAASFSSDADTRTNVYIPISTATKITRNKGFASLTVVTVQGADSATLADDMVDFLNRFYSRNSDFLVSAFSMESIMDTMTSMLNTVTTAIAAIAAISLLVGGIGVMNIMLVSITERTKEIGTRKAIGATKGEIRTQFIIEAAFICLIGGVIGIVVGIALGAIGAKILGSPATLSGSSILIAVGFSMAVGVFFGYYPANKAAKMDPIEALRYE